MSPWPSVGHVSALPDVVEFSWKAARVSCALIQNLCHRWNDRTEGVEHSYYYRCVMFSNDTKPSKPLTCPLQVLMKAYAINATSTDTSITVSKPERGILISWCLLKLTGSVHTSYRNSISRILCGCKQLARESSSAPRTQIPSPKMIPSVDQQSHTWDDSENVIHRIMRHTISIAALLCPFFTWMAIPTL